MMFSEEIIEYLHESGQMPDWVYYQQNGKSASENLRHILYRQQREIITRRRQEQELAEYKQHKEKEIDKVLEYQLENRLEDIIGKVLNDLLKDFQ